MREYHGTSHKVNSHHDFFHYNTKADGIGKAKQTLEMVGSALFVLPWLRHAGLLLLSLAVPLAYESVRRKVKRRVIYVVGTDQGGNDACHKTLKFWMQARGMGSKLIVGVVGKEKTTDMVLNACACSAVDEVIAEAPEKVSNIKENESDDIHTCAHTYQFASLALKFPPLSFHPPTAGRHGLYHIEWNRLRPLSRG